MRKDFINDPRFKGTALGYIIDYQEKENNVYFLFGTIESKDRLGDIFNFIIETSKRLSANKKDTILDEIAIETYQDIALRNLNIVPLLLIPTEPNTILKFFRKILFIKEFNFIIKEVDINNKKLNDKNFDISKIDISTYQIVSFLLSNKYKIPGYYIKISDGIPIFISENQFLEPILEEVSSIKYTFSKLLKILFASYVALLIFSPIIGLFLDIFGFLPIGK